MKLIFITLSLLISFFCAAQKQFLSPKIVKAKKIISVTELFNRYDENGTLIPENHKSFIELYSGNGTIRKRIVFTPNNTKKETQSFHYNRKGLKDGTITKNPTDEVIDKHSSKYNSNNLLIEEKGLTQGNEYTLIYRYNSKKQLISRTKKNSKNTTLNSKNFTYTPTGKIHTETFNGNNTYLTIYEYNNKEQKIKETFRKDSIINYTLEFTYSAEGKVVTEEKYDEIGRPIYRMSFTYTSTGKVATIEQQYGQVMGGYYKKWKYYYNQDNNISEIKVYDIDTTAPVMVTKYIYKKIK